MKKGLIGKKSLNKHLGCFGEFDINDPICKKLCILSLRCAIEQDEKSRLEILEDLMASDAMLITIQ